MTLEVSIYCETITTIYAISISITSKSFLLHLFFFLMINFKSTGSLRSSQASPDVCGGLDACENESL